MAVRKESEEAGFPLTAPPRSTDRSRGGEAGQDAGGRDDLLRTGWQSLKAEWLTTASIQRTTQPTASAIDTAALHHLDYTNGVNADGFLAS